MPSRTHYKIYVITFLISLLISPGILADTTAPVTTSTQTPATPDGKNNWYVSPIKFDLSATDLESGVNAINYRVDGGDWQSVEFSGALNLVQNPSFEDTGSTSTGVQKWEATQADSAGIYSQDTTNYAPGFSTASVKITAPGGNWHAVNNKDNFAVATSYKNMSASVWIKTQDISDIAYFKIYAVEQNQQGQPTLIAQSATLIGTNGWTKLSASFVVNIADAIGVYIDTGFGGSGTIWIDAATINSAATSAITSVTVATDNANHTLEYYSTDNSGNNETYTCNTPSKNCIKFKLDQTSPENWHDSGAVRALQGSSHELYVYTNIEDQTAGLSTLTNKYDYLTENNPTYGRYQDLLHCNTPWQSNAWANLEEGVSENGDNTAYLKTQKTDFCNSDWKICKNVKFYAEDMAGNNKTKELCINGPWIKFRGGAVVRSNNDISMLAESSIDNTDGLIEINGTSIDFFSSEKDWRAKNMDSPADNNYAKYSATIKNKTTISDGKLKTTSGTYFVNGNFEITNQTIPSGFSSSTFDQIIFVNGDLKISTNISISTKSTVLFIVKGKVEISKSTETVGVAIYADGDFYTAYNASEGQSTKTLNFSGTYSANKFVFQRTLQGTDNSNTPSENFVYEPKYLIQLNNIFGNYTVKWEQKD